MINIKELLEKLPEETRVALAEYTAQHFLDGVKQGKLQFVDYLIEDLRGELNIQLKVQEKAKEVVVFGRARVAGMVAEKYTRIGKIEYLQDQITHLLSIKKEIEES